MDKAILKKFAIESRQDLMEKIKNKINTFYIDEDFKSEQKGELYILSNEKHSLSLTNDEFKKRELLIKRIKELSLEQVIEEAAYTWFNRIIAIRYMEINDMLPLTRDNQSLGIRVLSSKDNTPDPEILKFTNLVNPDLDIDFKKEKYAELKDDNEKFKYILLLVCKKLGRVIPQVFDGITDYIDILIPDNLLNDTGFITKVINEVPEDNYNQVEIIGWLYQYYISEKKEEIDKKVQKKERILKDELPAKTQLFTPDWIVKYMVENTLGRKIIEATNNQELSTMYDYYIEDTTKLNNTSTLEKIKFIDPCCGSGHILVYAFDLFYSAYLKQGYDKRNICKMILENNIFGLDIDDRAGQLSILSLILKARKYDKELFKKNIKFNVCSIQESNNLQNEYLEILENNEENKILLQKLISVFHNAKEYGSLLHIDNDEYEKLNETLKAVDNIFTMTLSPKINSLIRQAKILSNKYDVVVTNPPYLGVGNMSSKLNDYIKKAYPNSKNDMFATFIERCYQFSNDSSYYALITQPSILFLNYFEKLREDIIKNQTIISLLHMGRGIFGVDFGSTAFVIKNEKCSDNYIGKYFKLHNKVFQLIESENIEKLYLNAKNNIDFTFDFDKYNQTNSFEQCINQGNKIYFEKNQKSFLSIPGLPISYWVSDNVNNIFSSSKKVKDVAEPRAGMQTGENDKFVRLWYEISLTKFGLNVKSTEEAMNSRKKWFRYNKGGFFRKWYGNNEYVVDWENDGKNIKEDKLYKLSIGKCLESNSKPKNMQFYFKESLTWSFVSSNAFSIRYSPAGAIFDIAGSSVFPQKEDIYYLLGFLGSNISMEFMKLQNPTLNFQVGNVSNLPIIYNAEKKSIVEELVQKNILLAKEDWDSFEISWDFQTHPLLYEANMSPQQIAREQSNGFQVCNNLEEAFNHWIRNSDERFKNLKSNEEKINEIFIDIYKLNNDFSSIVEDRDITIRKADKEREIKSLISYAVGCMFGRYSLDKDGLIFAGGDFDNVYKHYKEQDGGWAGASLSDYKYLKDGDNEIELLFSPDVDNIIPITDEAYFGDDIVERFKTFIKVAYGDNTFNENMDFIAESLGKKGTETSEDTIRRYFVNDFFNDHVKIYQKRPIYWLFDSGKKNGFKALVYMHRYNENLIPKVRLDYLHRIQTTYEKLLSDISYKLTTELSMSDKKAAQNRQADLNAKLQEIKEYDEKIAHIANQRISIDLDDGVKVNYDKFKDILAKIK